MDTSRFEILKDLEKYGFIMGGILPMKICFGKLSFGIPPLISIMCKNRQESETWWEYSTSVKVAITLSPCSPQNVDLTRRSIHVNQQFSPQPCPEK
jgi:hypothetical protein